MPALGEKSASDAVLYHPPLFFLLAAHTLDPQDSGICFLLSVFEGGHELLAVFLDGLANDLSFPGMGNAGSV